jgi:hypothetical protein
MSSTSVPRVKDVAKIYEILSDDKVLKGTPLLKLPEFGKILADAGFKADALKIFERLTTTLLKLISIGAISEALALEAQLYRCFIRTVETEHHHHDSFQRWAIPLRQAAIDHPALKDLREHYLPASKEADDSVLFILQTGLGVLGHTTVLLELLRYSRKHLSRRRIGLFVFDDFDPELKAELLRLDVHPFTPASFDGKTSFKDPPIDRVFALLQIQRKHRFNSVVWVTTFQWSHLVLNLPLASKKFFWAMKFHSSNIGPEVTHIGFGSPCEVSRIYFDTRWNIIPWPLNLKFIQVDPQKVKELKHEICGDKVLFGTLAREDKLNSAEFVHAVCLILESSDTFFYIYTGRYPAPLLVRALDERGLGNRAKFVGWVDTNLYAAALDVFIETFPLGCAVTGFQAISHGVPFVSLWRDATISKELFPEYQSTIELVLDHGAVLETNNDTGFCVARSIFEYISIAVTLGQSLSLRQRVGRKGMEYLKGYGDGIKMMSEAFYNIVDEGYVCG